MSLSNNTISDYLSLIQAVTVYAHRANLAQYLDWLIQQAQDQIEKDIPDANMGDYVRYQENEYPPTQIDATGKAPVPADWLAPKILKVSLPNNGERTLLWKRPQWIYERYADRAITGYPQYVARDLQNVPETSWPQSTTVNFTATQGQTVFTVTGVNITGVPIRYVTVNGQNVPAVTGYTVNAADSTLTLLNPCNADDVVVATVVSQSSPLYPTANNSVLIFGPRPIGQFYVSGTYYQTAPQLSGLNTTNWMAAYAPGLLLAATMVQVGMFIPDDNMISRWAPLYQQRLKAMVDADRAERFGSGPLIMDTM